VPRALDLAIRVTRLMAGVVRTLQVNVEGMAHGLDDGYTQATDLSEFIVQRCGLDYRSAYDIVGKTVRDASRQGIPGRHITGTMLDEAAIAETGQPLGLAPMDLTAALDPRAIIASRKGTGGAAPAAVESMIRQCEQKADELALAVQQRRQMLDEAEQQLLARATITAREAEVTDG
jgi:argininosuccinate lyase